MKKIKKEVEFPFDEQDLLNVVQNFAVGDGTGKKYTVKVPPPMRINTPSLKDFIFEVCSNGFSRKKNPHLLLWWTMIGIGCFGGNELNRHFGFDNLLGIGIYLIGWVGTTIILISLAWVVLLIQNNRKKIEVTPNFQK